MHKFEKSTERPNILAPAPHNETEEYKRFNSWFSVISLLTVIAASYGSAWLFETELDKVSDWLSTAIPALAPRIDFLKSVDGYSQLPYTATVISGLLLILVMVFVQAVFYLKTVIVPGKAKGVTSKTFGLLLLITFMIAAMVWVAFVFVPTPYDPRWPGMTRVFFWPIFPLFGGGVAYLSTWALFAILVGILKLIFMRGGTP